MPDHVLDTGLYSEQLAIERDSVDIGVADYRRKAQEYEQKGRGALLTPSKRLLVHWFRPLCRLIAAEKAAITAGRPGYGRAEYGPYVMAIKTEKLAVAAMHELVSVMLSSPLGEKVLTTALAIARACNAQVNWEGIRRKAHRKDASEDDWAVWNDLIHQRNRMPPPRIINRVANKHVPGARWPLRVQVRLGAMLLEKLLRVATCSSYDKPMKPAFVRWMIVKKKTQWMIRPTQDFLHRIEEGHVVRQYMKPRYVPMIVPPLAWTKKDEGGFLRLSFSLRKWPVDDSDDDTIMEAVNALNSTPLRINGRILEVVRAVWETGGNVAGLPRLSDVPFPAKPALARTDPDAKKAWKKVYHDILKDNALNQAQRLIFCRKLSISDRFKQYPRLYFPHQCDSRLRVYPIPLFLNYQGDDVCRGLLELAEGRPAADDRSRYWLEVHLANCFGIDKVADTEQVAWVSDSLPAIRGWTEAPLENTGWMEADKPWQTLAAAYALFDEDAAAHLLIQVDGSNNALQHYAAMLRCPQTAALVNLVPSDHPSDLYAVVASEVALSVSIDAEAGDEIAKGLEGWITRKVIKQTVMTTTYGVTKVGARRQLYAQLSEAGFPKEKLHKASMYLGNKTIAASQKTCPGATAAMDWIRRCAGRVSASNRLLRWQNPLDITVQQEYRKTRIVEVSTILQRLKYRQEDETCPVSIFKQVNGAPPNIVHSIDAAHLMSVAICCQDEGICLITVHDSYATHACDMDRLGIILREQFCCIHEQPYLEALRGQWLKTYPDLRFPRLPKTGKFDLSQVKQSKYAFM